jgi:hypothetical protein
MEWKQAERDLLEYSDATLESFWSHFLNKPSGLFVCLLSLGSLIKQFTPILNISLTSSGGSSRNPLATTPHQREFSGD